MSNNENITIINQTILNNISSNYYGRDVPRTSIGEETAYQKATAENGGDEYINDRGIDYIQQPTSSSFDIDESDGLPVSETTQGRSAPFYDPEPGALEPIIESDVGDWNKENGGGTSESFREPVDDCDEYDNDEGIEYEGEPRGVEEEVEGYDGCSQDFDEEYTDMGEYDNDGGYDNDDEIW